jgi:4-hydroxybenzoate polyprenyltransferase
MALVVASGFAFNDWADAEGDRANHPRRAIPAGRLSSRSALAVAGLPALLGIVAAWPLGPWAVALVLFDLLASAAYSLRLKGTLHLGNLVMALLNASLLLFGALSVGRPSWYLLAVSALAFLFTWAHEVLLSLADLPGDRRIGIRTTAVRLGATGALRLFTILWLAMILLPIPFTAASKQPLAFLAVLCLGLTLPLIYLRRGLSASAFRPDRLRRAGLLMSLTRISSLLPIIFLRLTLVGG